VRLPGPARRNPPASRAQKLLNAGFLLQQDYNEAIAEATNVTVTNINTSSLFSMLLSITNPVWVLNPTTLAVRAVGICILEGFDTPFSTATLQKLYPTPASYLSKYKAAADKLLAAGFLTQEDYNEAIAESQANAVP
jgi:hypothetical protein